jgi:teichuronic acid biosynthesis protein TuaE
MFTGIYFFEHVTDLGATNIEKNRILEIGWLTPRSFFPGQNEFAFFNALSSLVILGWMFQSDGIYKKLAIIALFISIFLLINSFSRAAIGGFLIGLTFFVYVFSTKLKIKYRIFFITFLIICITYLTFKLNDIIDNNLALKLLEYKIENQDNSVRLSYLNSSIYNGTIGSLGFGRGLGASTEIIKGGSYHSYFLEVLAEYGLWIFLAYLLLLIKICLQLWRAIKLRNNIYWNTGLLASCIAFPALCSGPASILGIYPYWLWITFVAGFSDFNFQQKKTYKIYLDKSIP